MAYAYHEEAVTIQSAVQLSGTIAIPQTSGEKLPTVLILAGSGQGDRDGNIKNKGLNLGLYKDLSDDIAARGFITLRYDKRGAGASEGDHFETGFWDLAEAARASGSQHFGRFADVLMPGFSGDGLQGCTGGAAGRAEAC